MSERTATAAISVPRPGAARRGLRMNGASWGALSLLLALALWAGVVVVFRPKEYILPGPAAVVARIFTSAGVLWENAIPTVTVIVVGFVIALVIAVPLGMLIVAVPLLDKLVYPLIVAFNAVPKVALAPLFVVWFGYGPTPRIVITVAIAFFPILVNTITGLRSVDHEMIRLARSMGANTTRVFTRIRLPHALPEMFAGLKVATSLAVIGGIIGEFIAADKGWGYLLINAQGTLDTTLIFALLILLALFATVLFYLVDLVERLMLPWHSSQRR